MKNSPRRKLSPDLGQKIAENTVGNRKITGKVRKWEPRGSRAGGGREGTRRVGGLMQPHPKAHPSGKVNPILADLQLVRRFSQLLEMTAGLTMVVAIIAQPPVRVKIHVIAETAIGPDLQIADFDRIPESPHPRLYKKTHTTERQGERVLRRQLLIFRRQLTIEPDDIVVKPGAGAGKKEKGLRPEQPVVKPAKNIERAQVPVGLDRR